MLREIAHWQPTAIGAACGCVISAALIVAILFEGWPAARLSSAAGRILTLALTVLMAFALHRALASYADGVHWTRATPDEWITTAALSYAAVGIICTSASACAGRSPLIRIRHRPDPGQAGADDDSPA